MTASPKILLFPSLKPFNAVEYNNYNTARCNVCFSAREPFEKVEKLRLCGACKLVGYCSRKHQKEDWKYHRTMCTEIAKIYKEENISHMVEYKRSSLYNGTKLALFSVLNLFADYLERKLERFLFTHENFTIRFPVVCHYCHEQDYQKLTSCKCHQIFYCSTLHRELDLSNHSKFCEAYRINFEMTSDYPDFDFYNEVEDDDEVKIDQITTMPKNLFDFVESVTGRTISQSPKTMTGLEDLKKVAMYSSIATIIFTLLKINYVQYLKEVVVIHVVGVAEDALYFSRWFCLAFFKFMPHVNLLKMHFIGPDSPEHQQVGSFMIGSKAVVFRHQKMKYGECLRAVNNDYPSVIVAFNCGFCEYAGDNMKNPWKEAIAAMMQFENVPIIFTSYTKAEMLADIAIFDDISSIALTKPNIHLDPLYKVVMAQANPFRDPKPMRNCDIYDGNDEIYYRNGYVTAILVDGQSNAIENLKDEEEEGKEEILELDE